MKICLINQHTYNHGDEAAKKALLRALKSHLPNAEIRVLYNTLEDKSNELLCPLTNQLDTFPLDVLFRPRWKRWEKITVMASLFLPPMFGLPIVNTSALRDEVDALKWADVIVSAPGGVNIGAYQDWKYLWTINTALKLKKAVAIYSISFGRSRTRIFDNIAFRTLSKVGFLSLRDARSQNLASEQAIPYCKAIDTAFLDDGVSARSIANASKEREYAVFVPHDLAAWHPNYRNIDSDCLAASYKDILDALLSRFPSVKMLPQVFGGHTDQAYFERLRISLADPHRVEVMSQYMDSDSQQTLIRNAVMVVGARYHSIVFAINQGVPFVSLSYEHKMTGMLEQLELKELDIPISELIRKDGIESALARINAVADQHQSVRRMVEDARVVAKRTAKEVFEQFRREFILRPRSV